jgi:hypothetical protein
MVLLTVEVCIGGESPPSPFPLKIPADIEEHFRHAYIPTVQCTRISFFSHASRISVAAQPVSGCNPDSGPYPPLV